MNEWITHGLYVPPFKLASPRLVISKPFATVTRDIVSDRLQMLEKSQSLSYEHKETVSIKKQNIIHIEKLLMDNGCTFKSLAVKAEVHERTKKSGLSGRFFGRNGGLF